MVFLQRPKKKDMLLRRKKIYTIIAVVLLLLLYLSIFCFSAADGESSSRTSNKVTELLLRLVYGVREGAAGQGINAYQVSNAEGIIRKIAHFLEYMGVGTLSYGIFIMWSYPVFKCGGWVLLQLFVSAVLDEIHQYFVPGRYASFRDVMIDMAGGIVGMALILVWKGIREKWPIRLRK